MKYNSQPLSWRLLFKKAHVPTQTRVIAGKPFTGLIIRIIVLLAINLSFIVATSTASILSGKHNCATCLGSKNCRACKTCNYCAHCNSGGSCGVCSFMVSSRSNLLKTNRPISSAYSSRCKGITKKDARCKRMVRGGGYCWQHS